MNDLNSGTSLHEASEAAQSALTTLSRLGRIGDADPLLQEAESKTYDHITGDDSRTTDWKLSTTAQTYTGVMNNLAKRLTAAANIAAQQNSDDSSRVFGTRNLAGDPAALATSRRDAVERASKITDPRERQALLTDAMDNHDPVFARALVHNAVQHGDVAACNRFVATHPTLEPPLQRLWNAAQSANNPPPRNEIFRLSALKPRPLASLADFQIAARAAAGSNA